MTVTSAISEANYFLNMMKNKTSREEFRPNLTGFLAVTRSIPDYLLEDYNLKFGLGIPLNKKLNVRTFIQEATSQKNQSALAFIKFFDKKLCLLHKNNMVDVLLKKRNIKIHRTDTPLNAEFEVKLVDTIELYEVFQANLYNKDGSIRHVSRQNNKPTSTEIDDAPQESVRSSSTVTAKWFFTDLPNQDVINACGQLLDLMKIFVRDIHHNFP